MRPVIAFDLTRLFIAPSQRVPRGIDRMELGFARRFLAEWPGDGMAILPTPLGARVVERGRALRLMEQVRQDWNETQAPDNAFLERLKQRLADGATPVAAPFSRRRHQLLALARMTTRLGLAAGPSAEQAVPIGALYLNTGQVGLALPWFLQWLARRRDVRPIFMLHDVIPIDHPEFVRPSSVHTHRNMVAQTARHATGLIVSTEAAAAGIRRELARHGRTAIPTLIAPLPVAEAFTATILPDAAFDAASYFVVLSAVEARKNHAVLLEAWRRMIQRHGDAAPRLVVIGPRWRGHAASASRLADAGLARHVIETGSIATATLVHLLAHARGLLMPSLAEGFGLPIIEALALGVPVLASDIPAHREAGGRAVGYLDPHDAGAWAQAIETLADARALRMPQPVETWSSYLARVESFLEQRAASEKSLV